MLEIFGEIVAETEKNNSVSTEDYYVDGLLCCGNCRTPKQQRVSALGQIFEPYVPCFCEQERYRHEEEEQKAIERSLRIAGIRSKCFIDRRLVDWTFANDNHEGDAAIMNSVHKYALNFSEMLKDGKGLLLYGTQGVGKSYAAACVANHVIDNGYTCVMTNFPRIINIVSGMHQGKQDYIDELCRNDLLIIDDLSAERSTEYADEIVMNVIDIRCTFGLPLIVTTNLTSAEMKCTENVSKKRIYSRLYEMTIPIEYVGEDRRKFTMRDS
ncbi:MAG: ATP-binding protein, partial [Oscillospiraceae bacterium]|nr:ATP-binding protein [Oscillospiraceae bacterium]